MKAENESYLVCECRMDKFRHDSEQHNRVFMNRKKNFNRQLTDFYRLFCYKFTQYRCVSKICCVIDNMEIYTVMIKPNFRLSNAGYFCDNTEFRLYKFKF